MNGPFECGSFPDGKIATEMGLYTSFNEGEKFVCDGGYYGPRAEKLTGHNNWDQYMKQVARLHHETVNARFKQFGALSKVFYHDLTKHGVTFNAIVIIMQLSIMYAEPLFTVYYNDRGSVNNV